MSNRSLFTLTCLLLTFDVSLAEQTVKYGTFMRTIVDSTVWAPTRRYPSNGSDSNGM